MVEPTRRERYRRQTIDEIKQLAMTQVVRGGESAVSLNGIAREMAMSPGALYRYFDNRDDLIADLVVDAYGDLARRLARAAAKARRTTGGDAAEIRAVATAYRSWALRNPNTYRLIFETTSGSGLTLAADRVIAASHESMNVFLDAMAAGGLPVLPALPRPLATQLERLGVRAGRPGLPVELLHLGLSFWFRLHGLVSLEIGHHLEATGVSADALFVVEVDGLLRTLGHG